MHATAHRTGFSTRAAGRLPTPVRGFGPLFHLYTSTHTNAHAPYPSLHTFQPTKHTQKHLAGPSTANKGGQEAWTAPPALLTPVTSTKRLVLWERYLFGWQGQLHDLGAFACYGDSLFRLPSESMSMRWIV